MGVIRSGRPEPAQAAAPSASAASNHGVTAPTREPTHALASATKNKGPARAPCFRLERPSNRSIFGGQLQSAAGSAGVQASVVVGVATDGTFAWMVAQLAPESSTPEDAPLTAAINVATGVAALFDAKCSTACD